MPSMSGHGARSAPDEVVHRNIASYMKDVELVDRESTDAEAGLGTHTRTHTHPSSPSQVAPTRFRPGRPGRPELR